MSICVLREQLADYDAWKAGFYAHFDANAEEFPQRWRHHPRAPPSA